MRTILKKRGVGRFRSGVWEAVVIKVGAAIPTRRNRYEKSRRFRMGPAEVEATSAGDPGEVEAASAGKGSGSNERGVGVRGGGGGGAMEGGKGEGR